MRSDRPKYNAKKTIVDGHAFPSMLEATRYKQLRALEDAGEITDLRLQPEFQVFKGYVNPRTGEKIKSIHYVADFQYVDRDGHQVIVEDTKGKETDVFRMKWKLVQSEYPEFVFRKLTSKDVKNGGLDEGGKRR